VSRFKPAQAVRLLEVLSSYAPVQAMSHQDLSLWRLVMARMSPDMCNCGLVKAIQQVVVCTSELVAAVAVAM
jgi:hypothetical protein